MPSKTYSKNKESIMKWRNDHMDEYKIQQKNHYLANKEKRNKRTTLLQIYKRADISNKWRDISFIFRHILL